MVEEITSRIMTAISRITRQCIITMTFTTMFPRISSTDTITTNPTIITSNTDTAISSTGTTTMDTAITND
ncbi:hypothetical protein WR25_03677 [Diploscapter pachys]|uniref:Uncharacterized protein n=1 Tax=Diploscapter pachys TaxID=2018661 RepID=A0A2A2LV80_9BILA|nr:hypothetical protein WR25_03677 [Diploscapter pachys]